MFERIGIDIVGGLPETKKGFKKILVIVEYMSKMVKIYPLIHKSAEEVAHCLWLWISQFGPPKIILSDQGTEFVNQTVDELLKKFAVERRVTSSYSPRTDGLCERANQTIIQVLRKHAEADHDRWEEWLPHVEHSYNTRVHSTTKFSPFEILYGIEPNRFINYKVETEDDEVQNIFNRSVQLKNLVEETRETVLTNIEKGQERQKLIQNTRTNPTTEALKPGTAVMVKVEGMTGKLESKYHGRYFVEKQTPGGNYKLLNALGNEIEQSFPINKLKPILEHDVKAEKESVEIEAILNKRVNKENDRIEYLVKWKDLDETENEWVSEDLFDEFKMINEYNQKIHRDLNKEFNSPIEKATTKKAGKKSNRGRPPKVISILSIICFFFIICASANDNNSKIINYNNTRIKENFTLCDKSTSKIVNLNDNCILEIQETNFP